MSEVVAKVTMTVPALGGGEVVAPGHSPLQAGLLEREREPLVPGHAPNVGAGDPGGAQEGLLRAHLPAPTPAPDQVGWVRPPAWWAAAVCPPSRGPPAPAPYALKLSGSPRGTHLSAPAARLSLVPGTRPQPWPRWPLRGGLVGAPRPPQGPARRSHCTYHLRRPCRALSTLQSAETEALREEVAAPGDRDGKEGARAPGGTGCRGLGSPATSCGFPAPSLPLHRRGQGDEGVRPGDGSVSAGRRWRMKDWAGLPRNSAGEGDSAVPAVLGSCQGLRAP